MNQTNLQILGYEQSRLGPLCLRRRRLLSKAEVVVTEITLNHELLMTSLNTFSEEELGAAACKKQNGESLKVLVGGLGLGSTAHRVLMCERVARVDVVEFLPEIIAWYNQELLPLAAELKQDARFCLIEGDVYGLLGSEPREAYDIILIDVDHAPDAPLGTQSSLFYSVEGLTSARAHLALNGLLAVWSYAENPVFEALLRKCFQDVEVQQVNFYNELVDENQTDWIYLSQM